MPERIQRKRTKGWRMPEGAVYVGRPTVFGNPWMSDRGRTVGPGCYRGRGDGNGIYGPDAAQVYADWLGLPPYAENPNIRLSVIRSYAGLEDLRLRILSAVPALRGRDLCCWCPLDQPCHADVLLQLANQESA